ncbi:MAG: hypothetical protein ACR2OV_12840 [Hyphomicrobiaceae bacterium]
MMRLIFLTVISLAFSTFAAADCKRDARAGFTKVMQSGPFHFEKTEWRSNSQHRLSGRIDPKTGGHVKYFDRTGNITRQRVFLNDRSWEHDEFGWFGPIIKSSAFGALDIPQFPFQLTQTKCLGQTKFKGVSANIFRMQSNINGQQATEELLVDSRTGLPMRRLRTTDEGASAKSVTTYRYDSSIVIKPPPVDLERRWWRSLKHFQEAVRKSEPECRRDVIAAIRRRLDSGPFRFVLSGEMLGTGISEMVGLFHPPDRIHLKIHGVPRHGGGTEVISIGSISWVKITSQDWKKESRQSGNVEMPFANWLQPSIDLVGYIDCDHDYSNGKRELSSYEYELFRDANSTRKLFAYARTTINRVHALQKTELYDLDRSTSRLREIRVYDNALKIEEPMSSK